MRVRRDEPVLIATRSAGKLREIVPMLAAAGIDAVDLVAAGIAESGVEDAIESHPTFEGNALAKARHFHRLSGLLTIADDSGLEVDVLGGAPGVRSKRWSGVPTSEPAVLDAANNALLLQRLAGVDDRTARFVCVAAAVGVDGAVARRGEVVGRVTPVLRGTGGFGYDACFVPREGDGRTFGEMPLEVKAGLSHRARAFAALVAALQVGDRD